MAQEERDVSQDVADDLASKTGVMGKQAGQKAANGVNKATRGLQRKARQATRKALQKAGKALGKLLIKGALALGKLILALIIKLLPIILIVLAVVLIVFAISSFMIDEEVESKAKNDNYQTETIKEENEFEKDPNTGDYVLKTRSKGNMLVKTFYAYVAQRGHWKVIVDEDGKMKSKIHRADEEEAKNIVDRYNREKFFTLNSDLLYLLDTELHAKATSDFFFPEQFTQPVPMDKNFDLIDIANEDNEITIKSTEYNDDGEATEKKTEGAWDYGFGSVLQYQKFREFKEKRATLTTTYEWDYDKKEVKKVEINDGSGEQIKETVSGFPKDTYMIRKVTTPVGSVENTIHYDWKVTDEPWTKTETITIPAEEKEYYTEQEPVTNEEGEKLYYLYPPMLVNDEDNKIITFFTPFPVTKTVEKMRWVETTMEVKETYQGYVWEKIPMYDDTPNTDGIVGDQYFYDYLTNYEAYIPNIAMESFDIEERTGRDIEELREIFEEQTSTENVETVYDGDRQEGSNGSISIGIQDLSPGNQQKFQNSMQFYHLYEIYGNRYGVDSYLLAALAAQENGGSDHIDESRYGRAGVGLMQVIKSTGQGGITAKNYETGEMETFKLNTVHDHTAENTVRFAAMYLQYLGHRFDGNVLMALKAYNAGEGNVDKAVAWYSGERGLSKKEIINNHSDLGWDQYNYKSGVDRDFIQNVLRFYGNPESGASPYLITRDGNKISADGNITTGVAIIGNGSSSNQGWFSKLLDKIGSVWGKIFDETPIDTLLNKEDYKWSHYRNHLTEAEFDQFMKLYLSFVDDVYFSEVEDMTLDDWKTKYTKLFENPDATPRVNAQTTAEYERLLSLFNEDFGAPVDEVKGIHQSYNGTRLSLEVSTGSDLMAVTSGEISNVDKGSGIIEITTENGMVVKYTNVRTISASKGDKVSTGDVIGTTKSTLGFTVQNSEGNNLDPTPLFVMFLSAEQIYDFQRVVSLIQSVEGTPYEMVSQANDISYGYFDCSGLLQWAFREVGIQLPRTAQDQFNFVTEIPESQLRPGDLIFFKNTYDSHRDITHVGLYIGGGKFWNAQSSKGVAIADRNVYWNQFPQVFGRITKP